MVQMEFNSLRERDLAIDLEIGGNAVSSEEEGSPNPKNLLNKVYNGLVSNRDAEALILGNNYCCLAESPIENGEVVMDKRFGGVGEVSPLETKGGGGVKPKKKKKIFKKHSKPPRPPKAPSMDAVDQKILREMSETAMLKRARIERMKALRKMKNSKLRSSNNNYSSLFALIITIIFCVVMIWQGLFSEGSSSERFRGSPVSVTGARGGFISVKFYKNVSTDGPASPNNVEQVSGIDDHGKDSKAAG